MMKNGRISTHLRKCGIVSQLTPPGTPERNGVSEHCNRTLLDMVRSCDTPNFFVVFVFKKKTFLVLGLSLALFHS